MVDYWITLMLHEQACDSKSLEITLYFSDCKFWWMSSVCCAGSSNLANLQLFEEAKLQIH